MKFIDAGQVADVLPFSSLIDALATGFSDPGIVPLRQHYDIANPQGGRETTLLMMPAWQAGKQIGVKLVTVAPDNAERGLPSIQGIYLLMDAATGSVLATMDAPALTAKRTAAASALASRFVSRPDSTHLLMVGTGTLAPQLIQAHMAVRPIKRVTIWGRDRHKAEIVADKLRGLPVQLDVATELQAAVSQADIISCATLSRTPLIQGAWLQPGQHLDLVGAYRPDMREADDDCIRRSRIVVDNYQGACKETGDLLIPIQNGLLNPSALAADLFELCGGAKVFQRQAQDITLFKSVGHALEDLVAAQLVYQRLGVHDVK
ncbi:ornithine cyclodeaminase family protein [Bowmanella denitrificans]|uniref:Ornithine cyclodeaminase family protein n=1 Tax=Bowmanella denitrificans TaxID=366582 RepID=A0ABP3GU18_9ALTE